MPIPETISTCKTARDNSKGRGWRSFRNLPPDDLALHEKAVRSYFSYDPESGEIRWRIANRGHDAGSRATTSRPDGRRQITFRRVHHFEHNLGWFLHYGRWPSLLIDHINGNPSDNRICNLREATPSENLANCKIYSSNTSGFKGVSYHKQQRMYFAYIQCRGKTKWLGRFKRKEDAAAAYHHAAKLMFGDFARMGDPQHMGAAP